MELKHVIIHKIDREQRSTPSFTYRDKVLDVTKPLVHDLIEGILSAYARGKSYGSFNPNTDNYPVQKWLGEYLEKQKKNDDSQKDGCFVEFTKRLLSRIGKEMAGTVFATGGYFIFTEYATGSNRYFLVAMVKDKDGITVTSNLEITNVTEIDLSNLHQAAQININSFASKQEGYLSFLKAKHRIREVLQYFTEAMGCTDYIPSKISTDNAMKVVNNVCIEAKLGHHETKNAKDEVFKFLKTNVGGTVTLKMISAKINPYLQEEYHDLFINIANSDRYRISTEFTPNATALRKYKKIDIRTGRWSLNFERELLGSQDSDSSIVWDGEVLTFRKIPDEKKSELNQIIEEN